MSLGERIHFFRNLRGFTMKNLGMKLGFSEKTADIRISQYENNKRVPRPDIHERLEAALDVSALALDTPNLDTEEQVIHTLLALEDKCHIQPVLIGEKPYLMFAVSKTGEFYEDFLATWEFQRYRLAKGQITREEYNNWKYQYPRVLPSFPIWGVCRDEEQMELRKQIREHRKAEEEKHQRFYMR